MIYDLRFTIYELLWQTRAPWDSRLQRRLAHRGKRGALAIAALVALWSHSLDAQTFEGRISATLTRGGETQTLLYTAATNQLRIERGETDHPYARDIVDRETGAVTLVFPHNHSFVRLKNTGQASSTAAGMPGMPAPPGGLPPGIGPQPFHRPDGSTSPIPLPPAEPLPSAGVPPGLKPLRPVTVESASPGLLPTGIGPTNLPGMSTRPVIPQMPEMPQMPAGVAAQSSPGTAAMPGRPMMPPRAMMPPMGMQPAELKPTDQTTNLLGYTCTCYELKERGETMEIWATDKLLPFQPWLANQPPRFGPRRIEEQWVELLKARKLFPLRVVLKLENGPERLRFEVTAIEPGKIDPLDGAPFQPPPDYHELEPLPF
jgi:hypothetical protein